MAHMWERRGAYRVLVGKCDEKRSLVRTTSRWRVILKWILKKGMHWIDSQQNFIGKQIIFV